ncbi:hypothetical protein TeGR_g13478 [Tetraparma gracilis]|uniref:Plastid lipid-associated protein/fibrillin conserved domain-containing protein n=1 Tax=Tetraparma gracilis TaxID=2962635 RepID=A0ABQ6MMW1_9STRA|nr:hypothetical protein TeGR_g13478 [Tetraparma gracilis]
MQELTGQLRLIRASDLPPQSQAYGAPKQEELKTLPSLLGSWRLAYSQLPAPDPSSPKQPSAALVPPGASVSVSFHPNATLSYLLSAPAAAGPFSPSPSLSISSAPFSFVPETDSEVPYLTYKRSAPVTASLFGLRVPVPFTGGKGGEGYDGYFRFDFVGGGVWIENGGGGEVNCYVRES